MNEEERTESKVALPAQHAATKVLEVQHLLSGGVEVVEPVVQIRVGHVHNGGSAAQVSQKSVHDAVVRVTDTLEASELQVSLVFTKIG